LGKYVFERHFQKIEIDFYTFFQLKKQENMQQVRKLSDDETYEAQTLFRDIYHELKLRGIDQFIKDTFESEFDDEELKNEILFIIQEMCIPAFNNLYKNRNIVKIIYEVFAPYLEEEGDFLSVDINSDMYETFYILNPIRILNEFGIDNVENLVNKLLNEFLEQNN